ncbi:hypothetical protein V8C35DRAFT_301526 [Trichoderma chlorosporum]
MASSFPGLPPEVSKVQQRKPSHVPPPIRVANAAPKPIPFFCLQGPLCSVNVIDRNHRSRTRKKRFLAFFFLLFLPGAPASIGGRPSVRADPALSCLLMKDPCQDCDSTTCRMRCSRIVSDPVLADLSASCVCRRREIRDPKREWLSLQSLFAKSLFAVSHPATRPLELCSHTHTHTRCHFCLASFFDLRRTTLIGSVVLVPKQQQGHILPDRLSPKAFGLPRIKTQ